MLYSGVWLRFSGLVLVSGLIHLTESYPFGAGLTACRTLIPGHKGKEPQPMETLPFLIEPESDHFTVGRIFKVRIRTASGKFKNRKIGGFFVQARAPGTTDPVGRWEVHHEEAVKYGMKAQNCSYPFDSITHSDSKPKNADLVIHFMPTFDTPDQIQFMGTIARDYGMFWANVKSTIVTKRIPSPNEVLQETTLAPMKIHAHHHAAAAVETTTPAHTPRRAHHVTQNMPDHRTSPRPAGRVTPHYRLRLTTRSSTTTSTGAPMEVPKPHHKVDPAEEKYQEEKEVARLLQEKNDLENVKTRGGHRDDETDRVQNDGSTNPDSQSVKQTKPTGAGASRHHGGTRTAVAAGLISQLILFLSCWVLRL